jgi:hypothetical protein
MSVSVGVAQEPRKCRPSTCDLSGCPGPCRGRAIAASARFDWVPIKLAAIGGMGDHRDWLIAIWDDAPLKGWGDTAEGVRVALDTGTRITSVQTDPDIAPKWLTEPCHADPGAATQTITQAPRWYLTRPILPPLMGGDDAHRLSLEHLVLETDGVLPV